MNKLIPLLLLIAAVLLPADAAAATYAVCAKYAVSFDDARSEVGDDHIVSNGDLPARGAWMEVIHGTSTVVASGYANESGGDIGCLSGVEGTTGYTYTVKLYSTAVIDENTVDIRNTDTAELNYSASWTWGPGAGSKVTFTTDVKDWWNIAAAAGWAASRLDGGMTAKTWRWYTQECPTGSQSCIAYDSGASLWEGYVCLSTHGACSTDPALRKYLLAHQMGHLSSMHANGGLIAARDLTLAADGSCDGGAGHKINSKEYQSSAAYEGIAHAWAAMAFNTYGSGQDCGFHYYVPPDDPDWNNNNAPEDEWFDCDGELCSSSDCTSSIDGTDYLSDFCGGTLTGRGTEVDWLRFWWDLVTDGGTTVSDDDVFDIWLGASPDDWSPDGTGLSSTQPATRLRVSAYDLYLGDVWDDWDNTNGVHR